MKAKIILSMLVIILSAGLISAIPDLPHRFYGEISYNDGSLIDDETLNVKVGGKTFTDEINDGNYDLIVDHDSDGDLIEFYVDGNKIGSHKFSSYESTSLDFNTSITNNNSSGGSSGNNQSGNSGSKNVQSSSSGSDRDLYFGGCEFGEGCRSQSVQELNPESQELEISSSESTGTTQKSANSDSFSVGTFLLILLALSVLVVIVAVGLTRRS